MSRTGVLSALIGRLSTVLEPLGIDVSDMDGEDAAGHRPGGAGRLFVGTGDPGDPEIDLSPLTYHYSHQVPLRLLIFGPGDDLILTPYLAAIGAGLAADPELGGVCDWCEPTAPTTVSEATNAGAVIGRSADFDLIVHYATSSPLS